MSDFKPALLVVDFQEDFCPPSGSLAVPSGRDIHPIVNALLALPFDLRIATKDWHPTTHISFAPNHGKPPFTSTATVTNPSNHAETYETRLWPVHCVQGTPGAELVPELDLQRVDRVIEKGRVAEVEMYSAFYDPFVNPRVADSGLAGVLRDEGVTDVFVVGLAADYCVKATAMDAVKEGFRTFIIEEGTRAVDPEKWEECRREIEGAGVSVIGIGSSQVDRVRQRPQT